MEYQTSLASFLGRVTICFLTLSVIYLFYGPPSYEDLELLNVFTYLLVIPLILIPISILLCLFIGIPIRSISKIQKWWHERPYFALAGIIIGLTLCLLSRASNFIEFETVYIGHEKSTIQVPNLNLLSTGWFILAFSILHLYPEALSRFIKKKLGSKTWDENPS